MDGVKGWEVVGGNSYVTFANRRFGPTVPLKGQTTGSGSGTGSGSVGEAETAFKPRRLRAAKVKANIIMLHNVIVDVAWKGESVRE